MAAKKVTGRIIHFANLPLRLLLPHSRENITEVAFKTVPSASKIEIKRVLESLYGLQVAKVNTLNMEGKKKRARGSTQFYRRPDYKKAYVTLKEPVTLPAHLFPFNAMEEEKTPDSKQADNRSKQPASRKVPIDSQSTIYGDISMIAIDLPVILALESSGNDVCTLVGHIDWQKELHKRLIILEEFMIFALLVLSLFLVSALMHLEGFGSPVTSMSSCQRILMVCYANEINKASLVFSSSLLFTVGMVGWLCICGIFLVKVR